MMTWLLLLAALHAQDLPMGRIVDDVTAAADPAQRYCLYLPSAYTPQRQWPVVLAFDPGGRGRRAVEQYQAAAEKFGYIVAASNVSRNGSWAVSLGAAQAMGADVTGRFATDPKRIYTAGMSGGARVALGVAMGSPNMIAGVVASSAGYPDGKTRKTLPFAVFGTAGTEDFNWLEMRELDRTLESAHRVVIFPGGHVWLPSEVAVDALEWLDVEAMKKGRLARDETRLQAIFERRQRQAAALAEETARYRALNDLAADFDGLRDVAPVRAQVAALRKSKAVKDGLKREQAEEDQERRRIDAIFALEQQLGQNLERPGALAQLRDQWKRLAAEANADADTTARRIARRVQRGLASGAGERVKDPEYLQMLATYRREISGRLPRF